MKRTTLAFAFVSMATMFAACGGGGGSSQDSAARPLLVDTASGGGVFLSGSLQGLVLETGDGLKVPLVLEPPMTLVVADPAGETSGVDLAAVPMHALTSVHMQPNEHSRASQRDLEHPARQTRRVYHERR